jgi:hypothetical protein
VFSSSSTQGLNFKCAHLDGRYPEFDAANWDAQIAADAAAGRFEAMAAEALAEFNAEKARVL